MWILYALGASIFWGITYVINEYVYKHISVIFSLAVTLLFAGFCMLIASVVTGGFYKDTLTLISSTKVFTAVSLGMLTLVIAELFIGFSISDKNAVVAGIIEISYPIFIILFSFMLFKDTHLTFWSYVGFFLVFVGICLVYFFNR